MSSSVQKIASSLWKNTWAEPASILLITIVMLAAASLPAPETVSLPILVYPPDGTSEHVESVALTVENPSGVDSLYVQAHQPFNAKTGWEQGVSGGFDPEGAAEIRVNGDAGGDWVSVRDENVDCAYPEETYGCVAGVYQTIRFTLPVNNVQEGGNTIEFKFNGTKGVRSGYRVLGVGFMTASDPSVQNFDPLQHGAHDQSQLEKEDVSEWTTPEGFGNSADIQEGDRLWSEEGVLDDIDGTDIRASCGSCHAKDGQDLKYFGYSNRTIVSRSRAHGLSEEQGKQIAAYIRSRTLRTENGMSYDAPGRPWNPPYQPGPSGFGPNGNQGPDEAKPVYWSAGAGLEWVLDTPREDPGTRRDMLAYLFPASGDHSNPRGVAWYNDAATGKQELPWKEVSTDSTLNLREMPLALQFPDWNQWLPKIHPIDAVPNKFTGGEGYETYRNQLPDEIEEAKNGNYGGFNRTLEKITKKLQLEDDVSGHDKPSGFTDNEWALSRAGVKKWLAVKWWQTFQTNHLEDDADDRYCGHPDRPWCEPLGWHNGQRVPFDVAGHIHSPNGQKNPPFLMSNYGMEHIYSHIWYQVAMVLNPGIPPSSTHQSPMDVAYQRSHIVHTTEFYDWKIIPGYRQFLTEIKFWQLYSKRGRVDLRVQSWDANMSRTNFLDNIWTRDSKTKRALHTAGMRVWWDEMRRYDISAFPRDDGNRHYKPEDMPPDPEIWYSPVDGQGGLTYEYLLRANEKDLLPPSLIDSIGTYWGQPMWPTTGAETSGPAWDEIANPTIRQSLHLDQGWNFISSHIAPSDPSIGRLFSDLDGLSVMKDVDGQAYLPRIGVNQIGTWSTTEGYKVHVENAQKTTFTGELVERDTPIELEQGWNLLPYYPGGPMDVSTALASIKEDVEVLRDEEGNEYVPSQGTNEVGDLIPGKAYAIYVTADVKLVYPNSPCRLRSR